MASPTASGLPSMPEEELEPEILELWSSRALLIILLLLILSFWTSYYLKVRRIKSIHETIVALFAGMVIGALIRVLPGNVVQGMLAFKNTIMLNVLLPPIILNSGFELKQENFFRNFAIILAFAFAGTFISACVLGAVVYVWALLGLEGLSLTIVECLQFGSTLSATDPVTILAIFNALKVDPKMYSIIFGESILNDAVAIVMFETVSQFHGEKVHILSLFHGVGIFLLVFFISMALGVIFGLACSLMLKHSTLASYPGIEGCLVFLIAYTSYFFSNAVTMSGIVSLLFCGITLKHYAYHNMSRRTQRTSKYMFATLAQLCENFIFIYLGLSLFTQTQLVYKPIFILVTALGVCVARYCAVFPISKLINMVVARARKQSAPEIPHSYQVMLFWAGLRGAVGVALAASIKGPNSAALRTTVLVTVVLTMIIFGGTTARMIEIVGIRTGVDEGDDSSDEDEPALYDNNRRRDSDPRRANGGWHGLNSKYPMRSIDDYSEPGDSPIGALGNGGADMDMPYRDTSTSRAPSGGRQAPNTAVSNIQRSASTQSFDSSDSYDEAETAAPGPADAEDSEGLMGMVWRDGQWFNVLDERYLLPVFSNATASRKHSSKKAMRKSRHSFAVEDSRAGSPEVEQDLSSGVSPTWQGQSNPSRSNSSRGNEFSGTFQDALSSLITGTSSPLAPSTPVTPGFHRKRGSDSEETLMGSGHPPRLANSSTPGTASPSTLRQPQTERRSISSSVAIRRSSSHPPGSVPEGTKEGV